MDMLQTRTNLKHGFYIIVFIMIGCAALFLAGVTFAFASAAVSYEADGVVITGTSDGTAVTITGCSSDQEAYNLIIPEEIEGLPVTAISKYAFSQNNHITKVKLPSGVTALDDGVFYACSGIREMDLNMVESVGMYALKDLESLSVLTTSPNNNGLVMDDGILFNKDKTKLILYPAKRPGKKYTIPESVTEAAESSFSLIDELEELTLSSGITEFHYCLNTCLNLKKVDFNMVQSVYGYDVIGCDSIEEFAVSEDNQNMDVIDGALYARSVIDGAYTLYHYPPMRKGEVLRVPEGVKVINDSAFAYNKYLEDVIFPQSLTTISNNTFIWADSISHVYVPSATTVINANALSSTSEPDLYGHAGSAVQTYCETYGNTFYDIDQTKIPQQLKGTDPLVVTAGGAPATLGVRGRTPLTYTANSDIISVDATGAVTGLSKGNTTVTVSTEGDDYFAPARQTFNVIVKEGSSTPGGNSGDAVQDTNTQTSANTPASANTQKSATTQRSAKTQRSLKTPVIKLKKKKRAVRISWGKVEGATAYQLYIKYPKAKKFKRALTVSGKVKSVKHKGLKKGKKYQYKVRAVKKIGGKTYYSKFSKVKKIKI